MTATLAALRSTAGRRTNMVPPAGALPDRLPTERLNARGMPVPGVREPLRRVPNARNVAAVLATLVQSFGVVVGAAWLNTWWAYLAAFVLLARGHVCLNILAHEAAHRLLFTNRRANDWTGRFVLGYPTYLAMLAYRRVHFAHHRDEMGPDEPDTALYAGYPIASDSWRRKLTRDLFGVSAYKNFKAIGQALVTRRSEAWQIAGVHALMLGAALAFGRPLAYVVWIGSWSTLWKLSNRLRAIAEHGGMIRSRDRRQTTHVVRQSRLARFWMVPYNTGWHLAHHVDMGVPWTNLPRLHAELVDSGWVTAEIEYPSYRSFWRAVASG
jgi:fatty acid desaturase